MSEHDDRLVRRVVRAAAGRDAAEACPDAERLGLYAERALEDDERPLVEAHVAACARCQAAITAFVRSAPEGVAATPGWGTGAVEGTGAAEPRPTWWLEWKWLMPVAATAAVITLAVWVQRPAAPGVAVMEEQTPEATRMRQAEAGRPEAAASTPAAPQSAAAEREPAVYGGAGRVAPGVGAPGSGAPGQRDMPLAGSAPAAAPVETSRLARQTSTAVGAERADERPQTAAPATADLQKAASTSAMRAEAGPVNPPTTAAAAGARPVGALADAREPAVPAAPAPAPETATRFRAAESDAARAARPAENREADRVDAAAPARAKAVASREATEVGASGVGAVAAAATAKRPAQVAGRVTYRTRAALPAGATIDVQLLDVSRMDAPAVVLGRVAIVTRGEQVPVPFVVGYDADAIDPRRRYTLQATITIAGRVAYRTTTAQTVLTNGAPAANVEVVVEPMR